MPTTDKEKLVDVLLVDDREDGLITLEALLSQDKNYNLVKARSGREAIQALEHHDFAVILLDVQMPELDGFETAEIIHRQPRFQGVPIIFVTAINKEDRYVFRGYEAGAVDYIFKPFDPMILRSKVAIFCELHLKNRKILEQSRQLLERDALKHKAYIQSVELENLRRYRNLADAIPHLILRLGLNAGAEYHNEVWQNFTGLSGAATRGGGWQAAIHPRDLDELMDNWTRAMAMRKRFESEVRVRRHDGAYRWHWLKVDAEGGVDGEIMAWLATWTDIHDRKIAEEKLKDAQKVAEAANDAKTHFLANMSHEIRTPLNAIMGFTELLLDPAISAEEKMKSVAIVRRNGHQLLKIVDEILDISKVEAGGLVTEKVVTQVFGLLGEVRALLQSSAGKKKIGLEFNMGARLPSLVVTDPARLRQILINVIGNAIKFTESGSVMVTPRYLCDAQARCFLQVEVKDTGLGIDPVSRERIFQPFSQADASTTRLYGGTGLGLALSRRLARALGGDVRLLESSTAGGSTFTIEVEVTVPPQTEFRIGMNAMPESTDQIGHVPVAGVLFGKRILLVEDAEDNQFLIRQFLNRTGAEIEIANNGHEGVGKALGSKFDAVLMDIQMPIVDGYEATKRLRAAGYDRPIIALTAHALIEERDNALRTGCDGHLTKPIDRKQLIDSLVQFTTG